MAKRRNHYGEGISLFPFMSILACLIGILTLMISVSMQIKEIENQGRSEEEKALADEKQDLDQSASDLLAKISQAEAQRKAQLDKNLAAEKETETRFAKLTKQKSLLQEKLNELENPEDLKKANADREKIIEDLKLETAAIKEEQILYTKKLEKLNNQADFLQRVNTVLAKHNESAKSAKSVVVHPGDTDGLATSRLYFVETTKRKIVIHQNDGSKVDFPAKTIGHSDEYKTFLQEVRQNPDAMILFLIRPDGIEPYQWAAGIAERDFQLKFSKLPIPEGSDIDLTLLQQY